MIQHPLDRLLHLLDHLTGAERLVHSELADLADDHLVLSRMIHPDLLSVGHAHNSGELALTGLEYLGPELVGALLPHLNHHVHVHPLDTQAEIDHSVGILNAGLDLLHLGHDLLGGRPALAGAQQQGEHQEDRYPDRPSLVHLPLLSIGVSPFVWPQYTNQVLPDADRSMNAA